jgi:chromosome segregation ATPase
VVRELRALGLDPERLQALAGAAEAQFAGDVEPLFERRATLAGELERLVSRSEALIELAEDRLLGKAEFAARKARLDEERTATEEELATVEGELRARAATAIDLAGALAGLERLSDIYDELEDVSERRRLLETCLHRLVVREDRVELHAPAYPTIVVRREDDADQGDSAEPPGPADGYRPPA